MSETSQAKQQPSGRLLPLLLIFLFVSAGYLYAFPQPNVFYAAIVLLHTLAGVLASLFLVTFLYRLLRRSSIASRLGWLLILAGAILGLMLIETGTPRTEWNLLYAHILLSIAGVGIVFAESAGAPIPKYT